jgi:hypothetical protein
MTAAPRVIYSTAGISYLLDTAKVRYDPNRLSLARIKAAAK